METLKLSHPIKIDGENIHELRYDFSKVTARQFIEAEVHASAVATDMNKFNARTVEINAGFHLYIAIMAVVAVNPMWGVEDIERVSGQDTVKLMRIGRNFTMAAAEEDEEAEDAPAVEAE